MLSKQDILDIFRQSEALLEGHFRLTSGNHSDRYIQCAQVLQYPHYTELLCRELATEFQGKGIDVVIGPAMGGIIIAYEVARVLGVKGLFTEREQGKMVLRRNFHINPGSKVLVVEDVITTGGSVQEVINVVNDLGGVVSGVGVLVDRSGGKVDFGVPLFSLLSLNIDVFHPDTCPLCKQDVPLVKPGSRQV